MSHVLIFYSANRCFCALSYYYHDDAANKIKINYNKRDGPDNFFFLSWYHNGFCDQLLNNGN